MNLKFHEWPQKNGTPLLYYAKLCTSFQSHRWIQTGVTVRKRSIRVTISHILSHVTLKFNGWPCKTIARVTLYTAGHLHTAVPHCSHSRAPIVHTAVPRENNEHGCVYLRCRAVCKLPGCVEGHPWIGHLFYATSSFVHHFITITELKLELQSGAQFESQLVIFVPCDFEIWRMTLKNNRAPLLCYIKLCTSFHSYHWIQTGVIALNPPVW